MTDNFAKPLITKKYIAVFAVAVFFSWIFHEFAHWTTGEFLGYKMVMTLNATYPLSGKYSKDLHYQLISAAGSIFTLCEAIVIFILMMRKKRILLYPFLFTCFYMRFLAAIISIRNPNDEARISDSIGVGKFTLPVVMTIILFVLLYQTSRKYRFSAKFILANLGLIILFSSIIILADMYFKVRLL